jgi:LPXTG-motif cell wall-anchored protein
VAASGGLASTGIPVGLIVAVGVLLLLAGLVLLVGRRMTAGGDRR